MSDRDDAYWFRARRIGFGWGLPLRWQGWVVLVAYLLTVLVCGWRFPPDVQPLAFGFCMALATGLLIAVCALKGEPLRARRPR